MKQSIVQGIGIVGILLGISGIAGAIELGKGFRRSVMLLVFATALLLWVYLAEKRKRERDYINAG